MTQRGAARKRGISEAALRPYLRLAREHAANDNADEPQSVHLETDAVDECADEGVLGIAPEPHPQVV